MIRAGHGLILLVLIFLAFGVIMVTSAGLTVGTGRSVVMQDVLLGRTTLLAGLAIAFMMLGSCIPVQQFFSRNLHWTSPIPWIVLAMLALLVLVHVPGIGREINGARRWIHIGSFGFQPSEIAKWGMVIVLAWYCAQQAGKMDKFFRGFLPPMILILIVCGLIATEDLGTAVLIGLVGLSILLTAGAKLWHIAMLIPVAAGGFIAALITNPYRIDRLTSFLNPYQDAQGTGYHMIQSMAAISGGGLAGRGLGNSIQKFGYLPEDTTDFLFAIICEELGVVGAAVVVALYLGLFLCGFSIVRRSTHPFQQLLGLGVLFTIGFQALINLAVVTGSAPTKGIALPLLSSGGTGWVLTAFCIGLLISIDRDITQRSVQPAPDHATMCTS